MERSAGQAGAEIAAGREQAAPETGWLLRATVWGMRSKDMARSGHVIR